MYFDDSVVDNRANLANARKFIASLSPEIPEPYLNYSPYTKEVYIEWYDCTQNPNTRLPYAHVAFDQEDYGLIGYSYCYLQGTTYVGGNTYPINLFDPFPEDLYEVLTRS